jgi:hypothetical protein
MRRTQALALAAISVFAFASACRQTRDRFPEPHTHSRNKDFCLSGLCSANWIKKKWPVILFLHGAGERRRWPGPNRGRMASAIRRYVSRAPIVVLPSVRRIAGGPSPKCNLSL